MQQRQAHPSTTTCVCVPQAAAPVQKRKPFWLFRVALPSLICFCVCTCVCVSCLCPPGKPLECFIGQYQEGVQPIRLSSTASGKRPGQKQCCRFSPRLGVPPHTWGTALRARPYTTYEARKGATECLVPIPRAHSQPSLGCRDRVANTQASAGTVSSSGPAAMAY